MKILPVLIAVQSVGAVAIGGVVVARTFSPPAEHTRKAQVEGRTRPKAAPRGGAEPVAAGAGHQQQAGAPHQGDAKAAIEALFEGNGRFVSGRVRSHDFSAERKQLLAGQHPRAIVLSCSDSRLPPELIFDQTLGELFVVRSAGNVVDQIGLASMEYAAEHLHTQVLVVLGHEKCGAITAAAAGGTMPTANLTALMNELGPSLAGLKDEFSGDELVHRGVAANVEATANEVLERSPLLAGLVKAGELRLVQAVYELDSGQVRQLTEPAPANNAQAPQ